MDLVQQIQLHERAAFIKNSKLIVRCSPTHLRTFMSAGTAKPTHFSLRKEKVHSARNDHAESRLRFNLNSVCKLLVRIVITSAGRHTYGVVDLLLQGFRSEVFINAAESGNRVWVYVVRLQIRSHGN